MDFLGLGQGVDGIDETKVANVEFEDDLRSRDDMFEPEALFSSRGGVMGGDESEFIEAEDVESSVNVAIESRSRETKEYFRARDVPT